MDKFSRRATALWVLVVFAFAAHAKVTAQASPASKPDYSKEPYVIQSASTKLLFQNDGKYSSDETLRVLIQSNAGLQAFGILHFPFAYQSQTAEWSYVRVRKPDGSVIETPTGDVMEVTPDISREAPTYSDLRDKQIAVKGLQVGDTLEYEAHSETNAPLIPGQFWYTSGFTTSAVVLQEELQISVPSGRYVQVKSRDVQPTISEQGGARIYDWKTTNLKPTLDAKDATPADPDQIPDVQITTFHSWDEGASALRFCFDEIPLRGNFAGHRALSAARGGRRTQQRFRRLQGQGYFVHRPAGRRAHQSYAGAD